MRSISQYAEHRSVAANSVASMSSGQLGIAQTQPQTLDFTSSARNEEQ